MRVSQYFAYCFAAISVINATSLPETDALDRLEAHAASGPRSDILSPDNALKKRKGGGGRGGGGGGGRSSGGGSGGGGGRTSPSSNAGGATRAGSGAPRRFGGGAYYGGGATVPYQSGRKSTGGLFPGALLGAGTAALIFPGLWLWSVYPYYLHPYRFYNETFQNATTRGLNQTLPVVCLCEEFSVCGCDNNNSTQYLDDLVGNGSYAALNKSLVTVSIVNDSQQALVINGTLPNGTTAPGGTDVAPNLRVGLSGYWIMGVMFLYAIVFL
ncbi:hypothetical protein CC78DRAFT_537798 [Lojkania enalia]|uniref:DUF7732 domain-containing protein n=1 Tax=Lojkania enalia TaxID=147567 RepID=A0A9P4K2S5_9PLEO|nr:hypothetical protein CC78DRAFT_537798 [Didymosphaeria enalia]